MLPSAIQCCLLFLTVSAESINSFHKESSTKKPDIPYEDSPDPKPRKPPVHISEFTDPDTGLNPFLDIEEGPTSAGRSGMKDKGKDNPPFLDFELVEGHGTERQWGLDTPKEPIEMSVQRWPPFEENDMEGRSTETVQHTSQTVSAYPEIYENSLVEEDSYVKGQKMENEDRTSEISKEAIIYISVTAMAIASLAFGAGVCWWRRKVKRTTQTHIAVESGDLDS